jgi:cold shock CspA family protein
MTIDFGSIKSYNPDRGFGFVGHTFFNPDRKVFFHIKKIKKKHPELAQKLDSGEAFGTVNFWYEIETTEKGEQVSRLWLNANNIPQSYTHELCGLIQKVESIWKNHRTKTEADELHQLLTEMRPLKFRYSSQLSKYIVRHRLGYRYPNISGIVRMEEAGREWDFDGGFPTNIYKIICKELDLDNQRTSARPIGFIPFKDVY